MDIVSRVSSFDCHLYSRLLYRTINSIRNIQGCSRAMTRTARRVRTCSKSHGSGRVGSGRVRSVLEVFKSRGSGQDVFESRESGQVGSRILQLVGASRVGSRVFQISRVGSGRFWSRGDKNITGRVRS